MIEVKMTVRYQDTLISTGTYVPTGQVFLGKKMYKNINNGQIVSIGNEEIKLINKDMEKYKRKHNPFSKLQKGDILTDTNNDTFEVLRIDNFNKKVYVRDLQSTNDEFWLDSKYVNKPELLS